MARQHATGNETVEASGTKRAGRRGVIAAAAALAAGLLAKNAADAPRVAATSGGGDQGFLALGSNPWYIAASGATNTAAVSSAPTVIQASPNFGNYTADGKNVVFQVDASAAHFGDGIDGIVGIASTYGDGVRGVSTNGSGVSGINTDGDGVYGKSVSRFGVYCVSTNNYGVVGVSTNFSGVYGTYGGAFPSPYRRGGVVGTAPSGGTGVSGTGDGSGAYGVYGHSDVGTGVSGESANGTGVSGSTQGGSTSGASGVYGQGSGTGTYGVYGTASSAGTGVRGVSSTGYGVNGSSSSGYGVYGSSGSSIGVYGISGGGSAPFGVVGSVTVHRGLPCMAWSMSQGPWASRQGQGWRVPSRGSSADR